MALYRNVITVEILSAEPWQDFELSDLTVVNEATMDGEASGAVTVVTYNEVLSRERMAELLIAQGSDPSFLLGDSNE